MPDRHRSAVHHHLGRQEESTRHEPHQAGRPGAFQASVEDPHAWLPWVLSLLTSVPTMQERAVQFVRIGAHVGSTTSRRDQLSGAPNDRPAESTYRLRSSLVYWRSGDVDATEE